MSTARSEQPERHESSERAEQRIIVALDSSRCSTAVLRAAAELASLLGADLEGLFIEDSALANLCGYPFQREVGSYTGSVRRFDNQTLERQLNAMAASMRASMAQEATQRTLRWRFSVRRGSVVDELVNASSAAAVMTIGRSSRRQRRMGSTAQSVINRAARPVLILGEQGSFRKPLTVLYTGSNTSQRALHFASSLLQSEEDVLRVVLWPQRSRQSLELLRQQLSSQVSELDQKVEVTAPVGSEIDSIVAEESGTLVIPRELAEILSDRVAATVLVP